MKTSSQKLFKNIVAARAALDATGFWPIEVADYLETSWIQFASFADSNFLTEFRKAVNGLMLYRDPGEDRTKAYFDFQRRYWELTVGLGLLRRGLPLVPFTKRPKDGPDHLLTVGDHRIHVECICVGPGDSLDRVPSYGESGEEAVSVPDKQIALRLLAGIDEKIKNKLPQWTKSGRVLPHDSFVIALNDRLIDFSTTDYDPPRIARILFGLGYLQVPWKPASDSVHQLYIESRPVIKKANGTAIRADQFTDSSLSQLSGVLHSSVDAWNRAKDDARDFVLVSNPFSQNPLPSGWFPRSVEWCRQIVGTKAGFGPVLH